MGLLKIGQWGDNIESESERAGYHPIIFYAAVRRKELLIYLEALIFYIKSGPQCAVSLKKI